MVVPPPFTIANLPAELRPVANALDSDRSGTIERQDFASDSGYRYFVDTLKNSEAASRALPYIPPQEYAGRRVIFDGALGDTTHLSAFADELTGKQAERPARIVVVVPGSPLHRQAIVWQQQGEPIAIVGTAELCEALMAKRFADAPTQAPGGGVGITLVPNPKQAPDIEGFLSARDTAPLGKLTLSNRVLVAPSPKADKFSINVHWYVEGFGHLWLEADNGGAYYTSMQAKNLQLNYELARSRVRRNEQVLGKYAQAGLRIPSAVKEKQEAASMALGAATAATDRRAQAQSSDKALRAALVAGEALELAWSHHQQQRPGWKRPRFGIDSRHYFLGRTQEIDKLIPKLVDVATITHYPSDTWAPHFEPREGELFWGIRDEQYQWLSHYGITAEARPIFWPHAFVTPDFVAKKSFAELKAYVVDHATKMVEHWGARITQWEIANEMHDWANVTNLTPDQITELIAAIAKTVRRLQPNATLIVNNTNVFGEYAGLGETAQGPASHPIRTPYQFIGDLVRAGVDFDVIGLQFYHPNHDLSDTVRLLERFEEFGKKIRVSEAESSSNPDPSAQANWAETLYRVVGTRPSVDGIFWYDISDTRAFINEGGLLSEDGTPKESYHRLLALRREWELQEATNAAKPPHHRGSP